jgi:hypothetical protein
LFLAQAESGWAVGVKGLETYKEEESAYSLEVDV